MRVLFFLVALLPGCLPASAQTYFNERYTNNGLQSHAAVVLPTDSGYVVGGQAVNTPQPGSQALLLRFLDPHGQQTRVRYYGHPNYYYYCPIGGGGLVRAGAGYAMAGMVSLSTLDQRAKLWRFNAQGDTLWTRTYVQLPNEWVAYSLCPTRDGGYALVGAMAEPSSNIRFLLLRTDSLGRQLWQRDYGIEWVNYAYSVVETPDHGFLLAGFARAQGSTATSDSYVVKTDSSGAVQWERRLGLPGVYDGSARAITTRDGGYLVATTYEAGRIGSYVQFRPIVYKLDSLGQAVWQRAIGPARNGTNMYAVHELADGSFVVAGQQGDPLNATPVGNGFQEGFAFRMCADGDSVWYRSYKKLTGGHSQNFLRDFHPTPDGGFAGAGYLFRSAPDTGTSDSWVFRVDQHGYLQAGGVAPTVRCRNPLGIAEGISKVIIALYPNPTLPDGRFTLEAPPGATATLTDATGREVWRTSPLAPLTSDLALPRPGLYLLRLTWPDGRTVSRRLVR